MDNIIVNIETYGDFDMPVSVLLMVAPNGMGKKTVRLIVEEVKSDNRMTRETDAAVKTLKSYGFTVCKSHDLTIGGGL